MTDNGPLGERMPVCDIEDPAALEAWYGNFGFVDHWRSVCLANCREIIRAGSTLQGLKLSEAKIDDAARVHDFYIQFLTTHLHGRRLREENVRQMMGSV